MPAIQLTPAQRKDKRADAHHLDPVVMIGGDGLTDAVVKEIDAALKAHGLIKVRVFSDDRGQPRVDVRRPGRPARTRRRSSTSASCWCCGGRCRRREKAERDDRKPGPKVVKILKFSKSGNHRPQVKKIRVLGNQRLAAGGEFKRARKRVDQRQEEASPTEPAAASAVSAPKAARRASAPAALLAAVEADRHGVQRAERQRAGCPPRAGAIIGCTAK